MCDFIIINFCREEIFSIHTRNMRNNGLLGEDISLMELAVNTTGYSGAEIAGCVRAASSYALDRQVHVHVHVFIVSDDWS